MKNVLSVLNDIKADPGKLAKLAIFQANANMPGFKEAFYAGLNPQINYFVRKFPDVVATGKSSDMVEAIKALDALSSRKYTGHDALEYLTKLAATYDSDTIEVIRRILDRDLACGAAEGTVDKTWQGLIPALPVMLATPIDDKLRSAAKLSSKHPGLCQTKMDGMRGIAVVNGGVVKYFTRNGNLLDINTSQLDHEMLSLSANPMMYDGELVVYRDGKALPRKVSNGIINKAGANKNSITADERNSIRYHLWDAVPYADWQAGYCVTPTIDRFTALSTAIWTTSCKIVSAVESVVVTTWDEVDALMTTQLAMLGEGVIVKINGPWEYKRSKLFLKVKRIKEADLLIIAVLEGKKKNAGRCGTLRMQDASGTIVVNVSGMTEAERQEYWDNPTAVIGKIAAVEYEYVITEEGSDTKSLYSPRILEIRSDKTTPDDLSDAHSE